MLQRFHIFYLSTQSLVQFFWRNVFFLDNFQSHLDEDTKSITNACSYNKFTVYIIYTELLWRVVLRQRVIPFFQWVCVEPNTLSRNCRYQFCSRSCNSPLPLLWQIAKSMNYESIVVYKRAPTIAFITDQLLWIFLLLPVLQKFRRKMTFLRPLPKSNVLFCSCSDWLEFEYRIII